MENETPPIVTHSEQHRYRNGGECVRVHNLTTVRNGRSYFASVELNGADDDERLRKASEDLGRFVHSGCDPQGHAWYADGDSYRCHGCKVTFRAGAIPQAMHSLLQNPPARPV